VGHAKLLEPLVELTDEARASGENQYPQVMARSGGGNGGDLVCLARSGRSLQHKVAIPRPQSASCLGKLLSLVVA
jgi:hypothetical protein